MCTVASSESVRRMRVPRRTRARRAEIAVGLRATAKVLGEINAELITGGLVSTTRYSFADTGEDDDTRAPAVDRDMRTPRSLLGIGCSVDQPAVGEFRTRLTKRL
jgi:hypothetical protein